MDRTCEECKSLREKILQVYSNLQISGTLEINTQGNDITRLLDQYISVGMPFDDAENFFRKSGFEVSPRPGLSVKSTRPDRYDVYATSSTLIPSPRFGIGTEVMITLTPDSPDAYHMVKSFTAHLYTRAL